jgi:murein DD-endopeptidase MepM/ murein hydrolase activator NlpD
LQKSEKVTLPHVARGIRDLTARRRSRLSDERARTTSMRRSSGARRGHGAHAAANAAAGSAPQRTVRDTGFVPDAGVGCHIALDVTTSAHSWHLGCESFDPDEYSDDVVVPDVALDVSGSSSSPRVSACNVVGDDVKVAYVSVYDVRCVGKHNRELAQGRTVDDAGRVRACTTFIVLIPPRALAHLCRLTLEPGTSVEDVRVDSDVRAWRMHSAPQDTHAQSIGFPLLGDAFLCTQSEGGELTHFFGGNLHAVDFRCDEGTPCVAVGDGVVVDVRDAHTLTGISVGNLFAWNSIILKLDTDAGEVNREDEEESTRADAAGCSTTTRDADDDMEAQQRALYDVKPGDLYVEYVHIQARSARVRVGDRVRKGQVICASGSVGFSPEPHLHFTAFRSAETTAETCRVLFEPARNRRQTYVPRAGRYYNAERGLVE